MSISNLYGTSMYTLRFYNTIVQHHCSTRTALQFILELISRQKPNQTMAKLYYNNITESMFGMWSFHFLWMLTLFLKKRVQTSGACTTSGSNDIQQNTLRKHYLLTPNIDEHKHLIRNLLNGQMFPISNYRIGNGRKDACVR